MIDLTKIREPFGLLDKQTQLALKAHGGPYEVFSNDGTWQPRTETAMSWLVAWTVRVKPEPSKPREWWLLLNTNGEAFASAFSLEEIKAHLDFDEIPDATIAHVREVI